MFGEMTSPTPFVQKVVPFIRTPLYHARVDVQQSRMLQLTDSIVTDLSSIIQEKFRYEDRLLCQQVWKFNGWNCIVQCVKQLRSCCCGHVNVMSAPRALIRTTTSPKNRPK